MSLMDEKVTLDVGGVHGINLDSVYEARLACLLPRGPLQHFYLHNSHTPFVHMH